MRIPVSDAEAAVRQRSEEARIAITDQGARYPVLWSVHNRLRLYTDRSRS